ncbi:MAG: hypothetical protein AB1630_06820 [bacterium]
MNTIDGMLKEFEAILTRIEILIFFSKNPYAMDTLSKFSGWLKRPPSDIAREFDYFAEMGIVEKMGEGENAIYSYTSNLDITSKIEEFIKTLGKRRIS